MTSTICRYAPPPLALSVPAFNVTWSKSLVRLAWSAQPNHSKKVLGSALWSACSPRACIGFCASFIPQPR